METITSVKERPILFSAPMVKAILEGRKTVTRRMVTKYNSSFEGTFGGWPSLNFSNAHSDGDTYLQYLHVPNPEWGTTHRVFPKYDPKDILWVRETWAYVAFAGEDNGYVYRATDPDWETMEGWKWKPSIFMPRAACRLRLEIQSITVERLQDITEEDAVREGAPMYVPGHGVITQSDINSDPGYLNFINYRMGFEHLWFSINGYESWNANPWIWRIEFKKL